MEEKALSHAIIGAAIEVHRHLGPGLLESIYEQALAMEISMREISVLQQVEVPITYKGHAFNGKLRLDLVVGNTVVVEIKALEALLPVHHAQLLSYLRLARKRLGLLINFNVPVLRQGIRRITNFESSVVSASSEPLC